MMQWLQAFIGVHALRINLAVCTEVANASFGYVIAIQLVAYFFPLRLVSLVWLLQAVQ